MTVTFRNSYGSCSPERFVTMRPRVQHFLLLEGDCTQEESAEIKALLDAATAYEDSAISGCWPLEYDEWHYEVSKGWREPEKPQKKLELGGT